MTESIRPAGEDVDCTAALNRMFEFLDHELPHADSDQIRQHLAECEPCLDHFDAEALIRTVMQRGCRESAPSALKDKILSQLRCATAAPKPGPSAAH